MTTTVSIAKRLFAAAKYTRDKANKTFKERQEIYGEALLAEKGWAIGDVLAIGARFYRPQYVITRATDLYVYGVLVNKDAYALLKGPTSPTSPPNAEVKITSISKVRQKCSHTKAN